MSETNVGANLMFALRTFFLYHQKKNVCPFPTGKQIPPLLKYIIGCIIQYQKQMI